MRWLYVDLGLSLALLVGGYFLSGAHYEVKHRLRQRRRGGML